MVERQHTGIIAQHLAHFLLRETCHLVEFRSQGIVGANVETTRQVVHRDRADTRHEDSSQGSARSSLDGVEETAQISLAVRLLAIAVQVLLIGENHIGEVVVLVDKEINLLSSLHSLLAEIAKLFYGSNLLIHPLLDARRQKMGIDVAEIFKAKVAMAIQRLSVIIQPCVYLGEVEAYNKILVMLRSRILTDIQFAEDLLELILLVDIIVVFEHREGERLAKATRANIEEILVGIFYILDERSLVYIVAILQNDILKILHAIRYALAIDSLSSFSYHSSKCNLLQR